ncbi:MAG TPA: hypothetical protein VGC97_21515 [Pyrinomonadaceae bacterium]|jgi:hypothetical protein
MTKHSNIIATYTIIALFAILGAWLVGLFDSAPKAEISGLDMLLSFLGCLIFFGAFVAGWVFYSRNRKAMTNEESRNWESIRLGGKSSYIKGFALKQLLINSIIFPAIVLKDYAEHESIINSLKINGVLLIVFNGLGIFAAYRFWDYYESEFALKNSQKEPDEPTFIAKKSA